MSHAIGILWLEQRDNIQRKKNRQNEYKIYIHRMRNTTSISSGAHAAMHVVCSISVCVRCSI